MTIRQQPSELSLSVITVTHGRHGLLLRKARLLAQQSLSADRFEWCVVTNADQEAARKLQALVLPFKVTIIENEMNSPVSAARNQAVAAAQGQLLLLSDDDVLPPSGCLAAHVRAHEAGAPSSNSVVIGDLRLPEELREGSVREPFERPATFGQKALWINATGANTSVARSAFLAVGGYDDEFSGYGGEDHDLALRLRQYGLRFTRSSEAWAHHADRTLSDTDKAYQAGRAHIRVWRKHPSFQVAALLGIHPVMLLAKKLMLRTPLTKILPPEAAAYEGAYISGACDELRSAPDPGARL